MHGVRAVFPGRFQPFHLGHLGVVKYVLEKVDEIVIVVGSSQESHTYQNPFTAGERIFMIKESLREEGISMDRVYIIPIPDVLMNSVWVYHVRMYCPPFSMVVARNPLVLRLFKEAGYELLVPPPISREVYSSTNIRRKMIFGEEWKSLVPGKVYQILKEIRGEERLREIARGETYGEER